MRGYRTFLFILAVATNLNAQTVEFTLESPVNGCTVRRGELVRWSIIAEVDPTGNAGLSMFSLDIVQNPANPLKFDIPVGEEPNAAPFDDFASPNGLSNPPQSGGASGFGGWQIGTAGEMNLVQIGGAQNTTGVLTTGLNNNVVTPGIGQTDPVVIASGEFFAPQTVGQYQFTLDSQTADARILNDMTPPPTGTPWPTTSATVVINPAAIQFTVSATVGKRLYVDISASPGGCGNTWGTAYDNLANALARASNTADPVDEIWVAEGVYVAESQTSSFELPSDVNIYGGFPTGGGDFDERDPHSYRTTLSGDVNQDDDTVGTSDNAYHVVRGDNLSQTTLLDGFAITAGNSVAAGDNPSIYGAAVMLTSSSPIIRNCRIFDHGGSSSVACYSNSNLSIVDSLLYDATIGVYNNRSAPRIVNCTLTEHTGPAFASYLNEPEDGFPLIVNSIFWRNGLEYSPLYEIAAIGTWSTPDIRYCSFSTAPQYAVGPNVLTYTDPVFADIDGPDNITGTGDEDLSPTASVVFDAGANMDLVHFSGVDVSRAPRISNGTVDLGAYEFQDCDDDDVADDGNTYCPPALVRAGSMATHGDGVVYLIPPNQSECRSLWGGDDHGYLVILLEFDRPVFGTTVDDNLNPEDFTSSDPDLQVTHEGGTSTALVTMSAETGSCASMSFMVKDESQQTSEFSLAWPVLIGDVSDSGLVSQFDVNGTARKAGAPLSACSNFRFDVNLDGVIDASDVSDVSGWEEYFIFSQDYCQLLSAESIRTHGSAGTFAVPAGEIEPRVGPTILRFVFDQDVRSLDDDAFVASDFTISSGTITNVVTNNDTVTVTLTGVYDSTVQPPGRMFTIGFVAENSSDVPIYVTKKWIMMVGAVGLPFSDGEYDPSAALSLLAEYDQTVPTALTFTLDLDANGLIDVEYSNDWPDMIIFSEYYDYIDFLTCEN